MNQNFNNLKVDAAKLKSKLQVSGLISDLIYTGVGQFLGTIQGPVEYAIPGASSFFGPSSAMIEFLCDLKILVPEETEDKEVQINS